MSQSDSYIFVSYAHKDSGTVEDIIETLTANTFNIWYDNGIQGGEEWPTFIAKKLKESSCCICFLSRNYVASKNCRREFNFADKYNIPMLVIFLEEFEVEDEGMDMQISLNQCLYKTRYREYSTFIDAVSKTDILQPSRMAGSLLGSESVRTRGARRVENEELIRGSETCRYTGFLLNGVRSGPGKSVYPSGDVYDGEYKNDIRHGYGKYIWANGNMYEGGWIDGAPGGRGKFTAVNGESYNGDLKNGKYCGTGVYTAADGSRYEGSFNNGVFDGYGKYVYANGDVYEGEYSAGRKHGKGKLRQANGSVYTGDFQNGLFNGYGKFVYISGDVYEGEFRNGVRHGKGKYVYANGRIQVGKWVDGKNVLF